jgi:hypothetical protein
MDEPKYSTSSPYVWICDIYHKHYPEYVKIMDVLQNGEYRVLVERGPVIIINEEQLSSEIFF